MTEKVLVKRVIRELAQQNRAIIKPRSQILTVALNKHLTTFNINDFIKQSKKSRRSEKLETKEKPVLQYTITGKCLVFRSRQLNTTFIIRNIISLTSFEMQFPLFSSLIALYIIHTPKQNYFRRSNQYFLRKHQPVKSKIHFDYVIDNLEDIEK